MCRGGSTATGCMALFRTAWRIEILRGRARGSWCLPGRSRWGRTERRRLAIRTRCQRDTGLVRWCPRGKTPAGRIRSARTESCRTSPGGIASRCWSLARRSCRVCSWSARRIPARTTRPAGMFGFRTASGTRAPRGRAAAGPCPRGRSVWGCMGFAWTRCCTRFRARRGFAGWSRVDRSCPGRRGFPRLIPVGTYLRLDTVIV